MEAEYEEQVSSTIQKFQKMQKRNKSLIGDFLGKGQCHTQATIFPFYYAGLFAWALQRHIEREGWEVSGTLGYRENEPAFSEIKTSLTQNEKLITNGQLFLAKAKSRLVITVDVGFRGYTIIAEGLARQKKIIEAFIASIDRIAHEENFYRGQKLGFRGGIIFLDVKPRPWDTVILSDEYKKEIRANTTEFLREAALLEELGIPTKRGLMLAGAPGTGKTIVCRAIMGEAEGITCITVSSDQICGDNGEIGILYKIAQDLNPSIILIEDIDLIGQTDSEFGGHRNPALASLLAEMDGVEPKKEVVTVATTNCLDLLDRALSHRPSRFDRVIQFNPPSASERATLVNNLCHKIALDETSRDYIVRHTNGFTPAQIQEVVFGLAIEYRGNLGNMEIKTGDIDRIVSRINVTKSKQFGFNHVGNMEELNVHNPANHNETLSRDKRQ
jgi:cell division protease FtsH